MSNVIKNYNPNTWPADIEIPLAGDFLAIYDERGPSIRVTDGDDVFTLANVPAEFFEALNDNPAWARAIGWALEKTYNRGRESGESEGAAGVQRSIRRALGIS